MNPFRKAINFYNKSLQYPCWWTNIGTGWPRTFMKDLIRPIGRYYRDKQNPIHRLKWFLKK